jgi:uncharacterized cupredoxin-like copper-binding protein
MRSLLLIIVVVLASAGCGGGSHDVKTLRRVEPRTIDVEMRDIAYSPPAIDVHAGETVTFVFHNMGQIQHEAFLGDAAAQAHHEKKMENGGMGGMSDAGAGEIKVDPGKTGSLSHTFKPGEALLIGCHEPGHYAAGMKVAVSVS